MKTFHQPARFVTPRSARRGRAFATLSACLWLASAAGLHAAGFTLGFDYSVTNGRLQFSVPRNAAFYFALERSDDLRAFAPVAMSLGTPGPVWQFTVPPAAASGFFRVKAVNVFAPLDLDGDGIDDVYELQHPLVLSPFNAADASAPEPGQSGASNYQLYLRDRFGPPPVQFFSREATVFNLGQPTARLEAISPQLSIYNALPGSGPPATEFNEMFSRETTVWNFGSPSARVEAISSELSVYNAFAGSGPPVTELNQVFSREVTVWNFGSPSARVEAISAEVSVFNFGQPTAVVEGISREVSVLNFEEPGGQ